jgi:hypothetical protein
VAIRPRQRHLGDLLAEIGSELPGRVADLPVDAEGFARELTFCNAALGN